MQVNDRIDAMFEAYRGKKTAIMYSGGFDSAVLAHHLQAHGATVALVMFDPGPENDPTSVFFNADKQIDMVPEVDQFLRYANLLQSASKTGKLYQRWVLPVPGYNALTVDPDNLRPATDPRAVHDEREHGLTFWSGLVFIRMSIMLSVAAAKGYDAVLTGHMGWNSHYVDESIEFAHGIEDLFQRTYQDRIAKLPFIDMPYREAGITKAELVKYNDQSQYRLDPATSISCNVCELYTEDGALTDFALTYHKALGRMLQVHCGHCQHCLDRKAAFVEAGVEDTSLWAA